MPRSAHVIINPAAGQERAPLEALSRAFHEADVRWDVSVVDVDQAGTHLARQAAEAGAEVVLAYGGDGTVSAVAAGLAGTDASLGILPGGTANVVSRELGVPPVFEEACQLACLPALTTRPLDLVRLEGMPDVDRFVLQAGMGPYAKMVERATRTRKRRWGRLAYGLGILEWLWTARPEPYRLVVDGERVEREAIACLICNGGCIGWGQLTLSPHIGMHDGRLDVLLLERITPATLFAIGAAVLRGCHPDVPGLHHWSAQEVHVEAPAGQPVQVDGNLLGETPFTARVEPGALRVLVPQTSVTEREEAVLLPGRDREARPLVDRHRRVDLAAPGERAAR